MASSGQSAPDSRAGEGGPHPGEPPAAQGRQPAAAKGKRPSLSAKDKQRAAKGKAKATAKAEAASSPEPASRADDAGRAADGQVAPPGRTPQKDAPEAFASNAPERADAYIPHGDAPSRDATPRMPHRERTHAKTVAEKPRRRWSGKRIVAIAVAAVLAAALIAGLVCAWLIWWRYDDAADFQGTWRSSEGATIVIDGESMHLTESVAYAYTLDTQGKSIDYYFSQSKGHAGYHFSGDRNTLVIDENGPTDLLVVLGAREDPALSGDVPSGVSVLTRVQ